MSKRQCKNLTGNFNEISFFTLKKGSNFLPCTWHPMAFLALNQRLLDCSYFIQNHILIFQHQDTVWFTLTKKKKILLYAIFHFSDHSSVSVCLIVVLKFFCKPLSSNPLEDQNISWVTWLSLPRFHSKFLKDNWFLWRLSVKRFWCSSFFSVSWQSELLC